MEMSKSLYTKAVRQLNKLLYLKKKMIANDLNSVMKITTYFHRSIIWKHILGKQLGEESK